MVDFQYASSILPRLEYHDIIHEFNRAHSLEGLGSTLRVVFSKDQTHWKLDDSDLGENFSRHAVGHNSGQNGPLFACRDPIFELRGSKVGISPFFGIFRFGRNFFAV